MIHVHVHTHHQKWVIELNFFDLYGYKPIEKVTVAFYCFHKIYFTSA